MTLLEMKFESLRNAQDWRFTFGMSRQMRDESSPRKGVITAGSFVSASLQGRQKRQCARGKKKLRFQCYLFSGDFTFLRNLIFQGVDC